eukprot:2090733-Amphidinium_carterae.1
MKDCDCAASKVPIQQATLPLTNSRETKKRQQMPFKTTEQQKVGRASTRGVKCPKSVSQKLRRKCPNQGR